MTGLDWMTNALCREVGVELFFPNQGGESAAMNAVAKGVCDACSARVDCLEYAMRTETGSRRGGRHGVWGGTTPEDRDKIASERARQRRKERKRERVV